MLKPIRRIPSTVRLTLYLGLMAGALAPTMAHAQSVEAFFKGKTIQVYSGHSKGGAYSSYARLVTRHIGNHMPGNPTAVYRNKPGASGLVLAHWLHAAAPKDGLHIGTFHERIGLEPLIAPKGIKFDGRDFTWIMALARNVSVCFTWGPTGVKTIADAKARELVAGASGATATDAVMARTMNATLGTKFKIISGYRGAAIMLALERGEVEARCGFGYASIKAIRPDWLKNKKIHMLAQFPTKPHPEIPNVPLLVDLVKSKEDKAAIALASGTGDMARPYAAPPAFRQIGPRHCVLPLPPWSRILHSWRTQKNSDSKSIPRPVKRFRACLINSTRRRRQWRSALSRGARRARTRNVSSAKRERRKSAARRNSGNLAYGPMCKRSSAFFVYLLNTLANARSRANANRVICR